MDQSHDTHEFHDLHDPLLNAVELTPEVSKLIPYGSLILTVFLVIFFLIRYYILEAFLLRKVYGETYLRLNERNRRGFINHHIAGLAKISMLILGAYPIFLVFFKGKPLDYPYARSKSVTIGDMFIIINHFFCAMYIFELLFRSSLSPVAIAHHIGAVIIAQSGIAVTIGPGSHKDGILDFLLCLVWGMFDLVAEFWPHVAIILYRCHTTRHSFLVRVFATACISTFVGTVVETVVVMWLFGSLWYRWRLAFKVVVPILHVVFSAAQLWGSWNFRCMWLRQKELAMKEARDVERGRDDLEGEADGHKVEESDMGVGKSMVQAKLKEDDDLGGKQYLGSLLE